MCGSSLTFNYVDGDETEILVGSVDEDILRSEVGTQLCKSRHTEWCENAVKGVTDGLRGSMWLQEKGGGILLPRSN